MPRFRQEDGVAGPAGEVVTDPTLTGQPLAPAADEAYEAQDNEPVEPQPQPEQPQAAEGEVQVELVEYGKYTTEDGTTYVRGEAVGVSREVADELTALVGSHGQALFKEL